MTLAIILLFMTTFCSLGRRGYVVNEGSRNSIKPVRSSTSAGNGQRPEEVKVVAHGDHSVEADRVERLGSTQTAGEDPVELTTWAKQVAALGCRYGHLDQAARPGKVSWLSSHQYD